MFRVKNKPIHPPPWLSLREQGGLEAGDFSAIHVKSVPINFLNPIKGTPFEHLPRLTESEMIRTVALFRIILPDAYIRLAGGRNLLSDFGKACFQAGANATITGDLLTTSGVGTAYDLEMIKNLGFSVV